MGKKKKRKPQWLHAFPQRQARAALRRTSQWIVNRGDFLRWLLTTVIALYAALKPSPPVQVIVQVPQPIQLAAGGQMPIEWGAYTVNAVLVHDVVNVQLGEPSVETTAVA